MRIPWSLLIPGIFAVVCVLPPAGSAQDADAPAPTQNAADLFPGSSAQTPTPTPSGRTGGGRRGRGGGGQAHSGRHHDQLVTQADADPLEVRVAYRRAKTVALARNPDLATLLHQADAAPDDVTRRAYLKEYYTRLFNSVRRIDSSPAMKTHVDLLTEIARQRYDPKRREVGGDEDLVNGRGRGRRGRAQ